MGEGRWSSLSTFLLLFALVQGALALTLLLGERGILNRRVADGAFGLLILVDLALILALLRTVWDRFRGI